MSSIRDIWLHAHGIIRSARQLINSELRPLNLSSAEGNILLHLLVAGDGLRQEQLVAQLDIGKAAISRAVDSLEDKGYVRRIRQVDDRRASSISLTEKAIDVGPDVEGIYDRVYALARQGIADHEFERIVAMLSRIAGNFSNRQTVKDN